MRIRFWGTRGSLAKPGPATVRYGGNTACVEIRGPDDALIVLDCGTGAHELGQHLLASGAQPIRGTLLITHTHWDHIQGFPFFAPLFAQGNEWDVYAPQGLGQRLEDTLAGQMEYTYFPITLGQLGATIRYHELSEGAFELGGVRVTAHYLNHPGLVLGYRLEAGGTVVVYATDHEPHSPHQREPAGSRAQALPVHREDQRHIEFLAGADLVIHDAQYTLEEYPKKVSWGHTPAEWAVDFALAAEARRLALFHHDPMRSDEALDRLVHTCRERAAAADRGRLEVFAAAEGRMIELADQDALPSQGPAAAAGPGPAGGRSGPPTILLVDDDPDILQLLSMTLRPEGFRLLSASDGNAALEIARAERPDLLLLDWNMPGRDGLEVCRALRAGTDPELRNVPVVLLTGQTRAEDTAAGFAAGVTDYLTKPFKPAYVRARVHAWLLRSRTAAAGGAAPPESRRVE
ncbi:MAG TPA: response regulator [Methylomirabilota bacterium]|nr:response regulator [Methylomirabilota bacterium]